MEEELRRKISKATKKAMQNPLIREKISIAKLGKVSNHKGYKCTAEQIENISEAHKGQVPWNKGLKNCYKRSLDTRRKKSDKMKGSSNPSWKGGITPENKRIRGSIENTLWREAVFARDNWTCQKCRKRGGRLHSHHIKNFAEYPELRFAIDNGITFCNNCHRRFHKRFGIKSNNEKQIQKYIKGVIR